MMKRGVRGKARSSAKDAKAVSTKTDVQDAPVSRERLRTIFDKFDVDGTGSLAIDDLVSLYGPFAETTVLRASLEAADTETDGSLSFEQFSSAYDQFWRKRKAKAPKTTPLEAGLPEGMQSRAVESTVEEARARAEEAEASAEEAKQHLETLDMEHNALTLRISALEARVRDIEERRISEEAAKAIKDEVVRRKQEVKRLTRTQGAKGDYVLVNDPPGSAPVKATSFSGGDAEAAARRAAKQLPYKQRWILYRDNGDSFKEVVRGGIGGVMGANKNIEKHVKEVVLPQKKAKLQNQLERALNEGAKV